MQEYHVHVYDDRTDWYQNGVFHRENGPAIEWNDGSKEWFKHGYRHREDGPAIEKKDSTKEWWQHGLLHRENGPAIIKSDGFPRWFLKGTEYSEEMYIKKIKTNNPVNDYQKLANVIDELSRVAKTLNISIMLHSQQHTPSHFLSWDVQKNRDIS